NSHGINKDWDFKVLSAKFQDQKGTLDNVVHHVQAGHALCAGLLGGKWRSKANVIGSQWILLDIDNSSILKDENGKPVLGEDGKAIKVYSHQLTLDEAIKHPFIKAHCALIYTTASHRPDWHKFRLIFLLPEVVTDTDAYEGMVRLLMEQLPHDPACKDASRVFYGSTAAQFPLINADACLPTDWVQKAIELAAQEKQARAEREKLLQLKREQFWQLSQDEGWDLDQLIEQALSYIPPRQPGSNNYDECRQVLMALADHYGPVEAAIIAEQWSPSIPGTTWNIDQKIKSFRRSGITIGTLFHIASGYGFRFPERKQQKWDAPKQAEYDRILAQQLEQERIDEEQAEDWENQQILTGFLNSLQIAGTLDVERQQAAGQQKPKPTAKTYEPGLLPVYQAGIEAEVWEIGVRLRNVFLSEAIAKGWSDFLDVSHVGSGKSHQTGTFNKTMLRDWEKPPILLYLDNGHRNPSTVSVEQNFDDMPVRHGGLIIDHSRKTALGNPYIRRPKAGDEDAERTGGNCINHHKFVIAKAKGLRWADQESEMNPICAACPFYYTCGTEQGADKDGQGYRWQRREAFASGADLRMAPDSAPSIDWDGWTHSIAIWEEFGQNFKAIDPITAELDDVDRQWLDFCDAFPNESDILEPIQRELRRMLKETNSPYGLNHSAIVEKIGASPDFITPDFLDRVARAISPTPQSVLGDIDDVSNAQESKAITSLRGKIKRRQQKRDGLIAKCNPLISQIVEFERSPSYVGALSDTPEIQSVKAKAADLQLQIADIADEIAQMEADLKAAIESREEIKDAARQVRSVSRRDAFDRLDDCAVNWLPLFLSVWSGIQSGSLRIMHSKLTLNAINNRHREIIKNARVNIFLDATGNRDIVAAKAGLNPNQIMVFRVVEPPTDHVTHTQIKGFGLAGKKRSEKTDRRIVAAIKARTEALGINPSDAVIFDYLDKLEGSEVAELKTQGYSLACHFRDSRGENRFQEKLHFIHIGTPRPHVGCLEDEWTALDTDIAFADFYSEAVNAEIIQEAGRDRAHRRSDAISHD
ncbi:MAG TPA: PriCT-2 domain-containing protein, partial [Allocoleopsis sp.]